MPFPFSYPTILESGGYNELIGSDGDLRPQWKAFFEVLEKDGTDKLPFYTEQAERLMSADILAATVKNKNSHSVIPYILSRKEFETISAGLIQRARLFNQVLSDLYGEQSLIMKGILPPAAIFGNPAYLPALKHITPANGVYLQEYAADIERTPDGQFWVIADKTQVPEGVGLTIKTRTVLSRVMPDIYAQASPERIFDFFEAERRHLYSTAPTRDKTKTPSIVLLAGVTNKMLSFEEAFLARNLGIIAVDPADLTVRDNHVYLKNVDSLKPVDVILRRIDDYLCDPLELKGSSLFGVAGLVEVVRAGNVALINPLGSGLAEIPAMNAFIHSISRFFNDEELLLPSIATWWCGQKKETEYVCNNLDSLKILDAYSGQTVFPTAEKIRENPNGYVAVEQVNPSMTPVLQHNQLIPAKTRLRFHLIYENGSYRIMSGGLAFTELNDTQSVRDIWILGNKEGHRKAASVFATDQQTKPVRTTFELTSRIADNMFWLGRNLERSEQIARLLRATIGRAVEGSETPEPDDVATLLSILALEGYLPFDDFQNPLIQAQMLGNIKDITADADYKYGLYHLFIRIKEMADMLHDRLSMDTWDLFTHMVPLLPEKHANFQVFQHRLNAITRHQSALSGLIRENMTRDHSWRFMEIGRRLERGFQVINLLAGIDICAKSGFNASLESILETSDSRMTYRVRYRAVPTVPLVFDLLVCDSTNPRSILYQILKLRQNISVLEKESQVHGLFSKETAILQDMLDKISGIDIMALADQASSPEETITVSPVFNENLNDLRSRLQEFSDTLTLSCFVHTDSTRQGPSYNKGKLDD